MLVFARRTVVHSRFTVPVWLFYASIKLSGTEIETNISHIRNLIEADDPESQQKISALLEGYCAFADCLQLLCLAEIYYVLSLYLYWQISKFKTGIELVTVNENEVLFSISKILPIENELYSAEGFKQAIYPDASNNDRILQHVNTLYVLYHEMMVYKNISNPSKPTQVVLDNSSPLKKHAEIIDGALANIKQDTNPYSLPLQARLNLIAARNHFYRELTTNFNFGKTVKAKADHPDSIMASFNYNQPSRTHMEKCLQLSNLLADVQLSRKARIEYAGMMYLQARTIKEATTFKHDLIFQSLKLIRSTVHDKPNTLAPHEHFLAGLILIKIRTFFTSDKSYAKHLAKAHMNTQDVQTALKKVTEDLKEHHKALEEHTKSLPDGHPKKPYWEMHLSGFKHCMNSDIAKDLSAQDLATHLSKLQSQNQNYQTSQIKRSLNFYFGTNLT